MFRMIVAFIIMMIIFHFAIQGWRTSTGTEKWSVVKTLTYSVGLAIITFVAILLLVVLF